MIDHKHVNELFSLLINPLTNGSIMVEAQPAFWDNQLIISQKSAWGHQQNLFWEYDFFPCIELKRHEKELVFIGVSYHNYIFVISNKCWHFSRYRWTQTEKGYWNKFNVIYLNFSLLKYFHAPTKESCIFLNWYT